MRRLFRALSKVFNRSVSKLEESIADPIKDIEDKIMTLQTKVATSKDALYKARGTMKSFEDTIADGKDKQQKIIKKAKTFNKDIPEEKAKYLRLMAEYNTIESTVKDLQLNLDKSVELVDSLFLKKQTLSAKLNKAKLNLDSLKIKVEFSNQVKEFASAIDRSADDGISLDDLSKKIQVDYNASSFRLEDIKESDVNSVDSILSEDDAVDMDAFDKIVNESK